LCAFIGALAIYFAELMVTLSCQGDKPRSRDPFRNAAGDLLPCADQAVFTPMKKCPKTLSMGWNKFGRRARRRDACAATSRLTDA
jgi:hypothetical protein